MKLKEIHFTKVVGAGNDFLIIDARGQKSSIPGNKELVRLLCDRKRGVGADGILVLEKSEKADLRMRVLNADGSEAEMCGNGARCVALYASRSKKSNLMTIETKAGMIEASSAGGESRLKMADPKELKLGQALEIQGRRIEYSFINTGVPHMVMFFSDVEKEDVKGLGRAIRFHDRFKPEGTNVNFVERLGGGKIRLRTYERGVEGETLACGTGATASAIISSLRQDCKPPVQVLTTGGDILTVEFKVGPAEKVHDVYLTGPAKIVFEGTYSLI